MKTIFLVSGIFPGKADSVILLGFKYSINPQNLIKIVGAIFEKINIFNFFLCELPLILGEREKKARDIYKRTLDIEFERDRSIGLGSTIGGRLIDRHRQTPDTHTDRERERERKREREIEREREGEGERGRGRERERGRKRETFF